MSVADRVYVSAVTAAYRCAECRRTIDPVAKEVIASTYYVLRSVREGLLRREVERRFRVRGLYHWCTNATGEGWYCGPTELSAERG